jgi:tetratricopeptide repeat protein
MPDNTEKQESYTTLQEHDAEFLRIALHALDTAGLEVTASLLMDSSPNEQFAAMVNISRVVSRLFPFQEQRETFQRMLDLLKTCGEISGTQEAQSFYHYWQGKQDNQENRVKSAISHYEFAIEHMPLRVNIRLGAIDTLARLMYQQGDLMKGEHLYEKLIEEAQQTGDVEGTAYGYLGLGKIAVTKESLANAKSWLHEAWLQAQQVNDPTLISLILTMQGIAYARSEDPEGASKYYQQLEQYLNEHGDQLSEEVQNRAWSSLAANRAVLATREHNHKEASKFATEALARQSSLTGLEQIENLSIVGSIEFFITGDQESGKQHLLSAFNLAEQMRYPNAIAEAGGELTSAYATLGYYEPAYRVASTVIDALERLRRQAGSETSRLHYLEEKVVIYSQIVVLCLLLTRLKNMPHYQSEALTYVERAKSRTLIEALGRTVSIVPPTSLPRELLQRETRRLDQLHALEMQLRTPLDDTTKQQLQRAYTMAQNEIDEIWQDIATVAPEYAALRQGQPITSEDIQQMLSS